MRDPSAHQRASGDDAARTAKSPGRHRRKLVFALATCLVLVAGYLLLESLGLTRYVTSPELLRAQIDRLGAWGPVIVVVLMAANVVFSPLPSASILIASGAAFGSLLGTLYGLLGAEVGSLIAFFIARSVGADVVRRWFGHNPALRMLGTQNTLMGIVFVLRLVPLMSFDLISYGAGLTPLVWWRFAIANLAGMAPMTFVLVQLGSNAVAATPAGTALMIAAIAGVALLAGLFAWRLRRWQTGEAVEATAHRISK